MQDAPYREIPLRHRDGSVRATALVDEDDYDRLAAHRWFLTPDGYAARWRRRRERGTRLVRMHRAVLLLSPGDGQVDHISRNKLDNRKTNLRIISQAANAQNLSLRTGGSSKYRGVCWHKGARKWTAYGSVSGRRQHLGLFDDESAATTVAAAWRAVNLPFSEDARAGIADTT